MPFDLCIVPGKKYDRCAYLIYSKLIRNLLIFIGFALILSACHTDRTSFGFLTQNKELRPTEIASYQSKITELISRRVSPEIGSKLLSEKDDAIMLYIPAGAFPMGSDDGSADEQPVHAVYLNAFWIDQNEVTNAQYARCVNEGICALPTDPAAYYDSSYTQHPIVFLEWEDAAAYCEWADRRLPTEAEWEKAARGTDGRTYPWGEVGDCSRANFWDCPEFESTSPVGHYGEKGISPYGLYDMAGNVWEWVWDWYDVDYYRSSPTSNPTGPTSGIYHVWRGGSWNCNQTSARSAGRGNYNPDYWRDLIGFRCAMDIEYQVLIDNN